MSTSCTFPVCSIKKLPSTQVVLSVGGAAITHLRDVVHHMATAVWHLGRKKRGAREQTIIFNITCGVADLWWAGISSVK